jgi:AraC-like DNA-binding protein/quercetin dioxygenase-like cupin family protein
MARDGHLLVGAPVTGGAMALGEFDLPAGYWFDWHEHPQHQLVWAARGVVLVTVDTAHWVLPPTRALWAPAGTRHRTGASGTAALRGIFVEPARCPIDWAKPTMIEVSTLLAELLHYLTGDRVVGPERLRAEAVIFDLLEPVRVAPIGAPVPTDPRARHVAEALAADPADSRTLEEHGHAVGASARTLARAFSADTGFTFSRWRTQARLRAALPLLANGAPVESVSRRVGYESVSAFVAAFRREVGLTPGAYFTG